MWVIGGSEPLEQFCLKLGFVSIILCKCKTYILAVNACSVLIITMLVYVLCSLVVFFCSACHPMIYVLWYLLCHFSCFMQLLVSLASHGTSNLFSKCWCECDINMLRIPVLPMRVPLLATSDDAASSPPMSSSLWAWWFPLLAHIKYNIYIWMDWVW